MKIISTEVFYKYGEGERDAHGNLYDPATLVTFRSEELVSAFTTYLNEIVFLYEVAKRVDGMITQEQMIPMPFKVGNMKEHAIKSEKLNLVEDACIYAAHIVGESKSTNPLIDNHILDEKINWARELAEKRGWTKEGLNEYCFKGELLNYYGAEKGLGSRIPRS